jgi:hypothetical protein
VIPVLNTQYSGLAALDEQHMRLCADGHLRCSALRIYVSSIRTIELGGKSVASVEMHPAFSLVSDSISGSVMGSMALVSLLLLPLG